MASCKLCSRMFAKRKRDFFSGCFSDRPLSEPCELCLLAEDPWVERRSGLGAPCSSLLSQHAGKSRGCGCHGVCTLMPPAWRRPPGPGPGPCCGWSNQKCCMVPGPLLLAIAPASSNQDWKLKLPSPRLAMVIMLKVHLEVQGTTGRQGLDTCTDPFISYVKNCETRALSSLCGAAPPGGPNISTVCRWQSQHSSPGWLYPGAHILS